MGDYLALENGVPTDRLAKDNSAGAADAGRVIKTNGAGKLDPSLLPEGVGPEQRTIEASENLAAGELINIWSDGGTAKARKADATSAGKEANGFTLSAVTAGQAATVWIEEAVLTGQAGLTPGARYFLDTAAGAMTDTAPSGSGNVAQVVGTALSATELMFRPDTPITIA